MKKTTHTKQEHTHVKNLKRQLMTKYFLWRLKLHVGNWNEWPLVLRTWFSVLSGGRSGWRGMTWHRIFKITFYSWWTELLCSWNLNCTEIIIHCVKSWQQVSATEMANAICTSFFCPVWLWRLTFWPQTCSVSCSWRGVRLFPGT